MARFISNRYREHLLIVADLSRGPERELTACLKKRSASQRFINNRCKTTCCPKGADPSLPPFSEQTAGLGFQWSQANQYHFYIARAVVELKTMQSALMAYRTNKGFST